MQSFAPQEVTAAGRVLLWQGEVEVRMEKSMSLYNGEKKIQADGVATVTTHRLLWMHDKPPEGLTSGKLSLPLSQIANVQDKSGGMFGSSKLVVTMLSGGSLMFGFKGGGRDVFGKALRECLSKREWERPAPGSSVGSSNSSEHAASSSLPAAAATGGPVMNAGIGSILERRKKEENVTSRVMEGGLGDLDGLMAHAREMVDIAGRIKDGLKERKKNRGSGEGSSQEDDDEEEMLIRAGLISPVSKEVTGGGVLFYQQLSRQISDFLVPRLRRGGGTITLTDAYCLYNRARGIDMVSPGDMRKACEMFAPQGLGIRMETFTSGVVVICLSDAKAGADAVRDLVVGDAGAGGGDGDGDGEGMTAAEVAKALGLSVKMARDLLEREETKGGLCRDESLDGIRFFANRISVWASAQ